MLSYKCFTSLSGPVGFFVCFSHQLAVVMWLFTYVGAVFNGITILILGKHRGNQDLHHIHTPHGGLGRSGCLPIEWLPLKMSEFKVNPKWNTPHSHILGEEMSPHSYS